MASTNGILRASTTFRRAIAIVCGGVVARDPRFVMPLARRYNEGNEYACRNSISAVIQFNTRSAGMTRQKAASVESPSRLRQTIPGTPPKMPTQRRCSICCLTRQVACHGSAARVVAPATVVTWHDGRCKLALLRPHYACFLSTFKNTHQSLG